MKHFLVVLFMILGSICSLASVGLTLSSSAFRPDNPIPAKYTCQGENTPPPLAWSNLPKNTQSLALILEDPDASNGNWIHWIVFNINPDTKQLNTYPLTHEGLEGSNSWGHENYGGPCPPSGEHHYIFTLYALDIRLNEKTGINAADLRRAMSGHILEQTKLVGTYSKHSH